VSDLIRDLFSGYEPIGSDHTMEREVFYLSLPSSLRQFYGDHNGFYAFDRALLVRPFRSMRGVSGLEDWNDPDLWKMRFSRELGEYVFFAEDTVGYSFCLGTDQRVYLFDPEHGLLEHYAESVEEWAEVILADPSEVGSSLAALWSEEHGEIPFGYRIPPVIPFVMKESEGMGNILAPELPLIKYRASLARTLRDVEDGEQVQVQSLAEYLREQS
jgi:hypothetical protein